MPTPTPSLEGLQVRYQTALDKTVATVTTGTITAGYLMYADTSGGFTVVSTATAVASYQRAPTIWVADFTQSNGNTITGVRGFCRVVLDSQGTAPAGGLLFPSTVTAGLVSTVPWGTGGTIGGTAAANAPVVGYIVTGYGTASGTIMAYISPGGNNNS